jgi:ABC-type polysaccharide/polyol phosphate transport system ATPase subunit
MDAAEDPTPTASQGTPSVVVSHVDIVYRIYGAKRRRSAATQPESRAKKLLNHGRNVGAVHEVHAVKDVSFVANHGESIGIIGRNGSGKSTLLRSIAGLIPPTKGRVWVAGEPALLGVNAVLMSKLSGARNIYIGAQALGLTKQQIADRFDDIVEFSGLGDFIHLPMSAYSSGMAARLRFAISTAVTPDVLMVDEALATGDADFKQRSAERIAKIRDEAGTVFLVSHSNRTIREICDRVLWIDKGRLIMDGPAEEVVDAYQETLPKRPQRKRGAARKAGDKKDADRAAGEDTADDHSPASADAEPTGARADTGEQSAGRVPSPAAERQRVPDAPPSEDTSLRDDPTRPLS